MWRLVSTAAATAAGTECAPSRAWRDPNLFVHALWWLVRLNTAPLPPRPQEQHHLRILGSTADNPVPVMSQVELTGWSVQREILGYAIDTQRMAIAIPTKKTGVAAWV